MKLLLRVSLLFIVFTQSAQAEAEGFKFRSVTCLGDNETVAFDYCYIKKFSHSFITINVGLNFLKTVYKPIHVQSIYSYRKNGNFQPVIDSKKVDWCSLMVGAILNPILTAVTHDLAKNVPELFHTCPYRSELIHLKNITSVYNGLLRALPTGVYKVEVIVFKYVKQIARFTLISDFRK
jgi:hypothetical protein